MEFAIISPAMLNLYKDCDLKFYYQYVEQVSAPILDEKFVEGKNIHSLASYYLNGHNIEKYYSQLSKKERKYWDYLKACDYFKYDVVGVEKSLSMKIDDYWVGGRLDAIVKNGDDYYIIDYKTGGVISDKTYDYQTIVYLLVCDEYFKNKKSLTFVYLDLKNQKEVKICFNETLKTDYVERIKTVCAGMCSMDYSKLGKTVCSELNCQYSKFCRVYGY